MATVGQAVQIALWGPDSKGLNVLDHDFNVKKVSVERHDGGRIVVATGHLSHALDWRTDDQVYYQITIEDQAVKDITRKDAAGGLTPFIAPIAAIVATYLGVPISEEQASTILNTLERLPDGTASWSAAADVIIASIAIAVQQREIKGKEVVDYLITVKTGTEEDAGTDANVYMILIGDLGTSNEWHLDNSEDNFESGKIDIFQARLDDVGPLTHIKLKTDGSGEKPGWLPEYVKVEKRNGIQSGKEWVFHLNTWIDQNTQYESSFIPVSENNAKYTVSFVTGARDGAGTDASVYIRLFNNDIVTREVFCGNETNNFERGKTDAFVYIFEDIKPITHVRVRHDNSGSRPGWFLESVTVGWGDPPAEGWQWQFPISRWLDSQNGVDTGKVPREPF